jgi:hypothetical protein
MALEGEAFDDLRSEPCDFSRVEASEDLSRAGDPEDLSLVDSLLAGSLLSESALRSRAGSALLAGSRRVSILRGDFGVCAPGFSRERRVSVAGVLRSTVRAVPPSVRSRP